jgi:hypothetical protein
MLTRTNKRPIQHNHKIYACPTSPWACTSSNLLFVAMRWNVRVRTTVKEFVYEDSLLSLVGCDETGYAVMSQAKPESNRYGD